MTTDERIEAVEYVLKEVREAMQVIQNRGYIVTDEELIEYFEEKLKELKNQNEGTHNS